ncbi:dehydrogenase [Pseudonocardia sp. C8]|nr:dehydrogenase [Pseudonocardia sp. C8]
MGMREWLQSWPAARQLTGQDPLGRGAAARSPGTDRKIARTALADGVTKSVCPFCAVGCGQNVYTENGRVTHVEGDPDSPISRGRLCPKGSSTLSLVTSPQRPARVRYRRPYGTEWEDLDLDTALEMITDRVLETRRRTWEDVDDLGRHLHRTMGIASLGGATLDNEENYLMKKLYTAMGAVQVENQARI